MGELVLDHLLRISNPNNFVIHERKRLWPLAVHSEISPWELRRQQFSRVPEWTTLQHFQTVVEALGLCDNQGLAKQSMK